MSGKRNGVTVEAPAAPTLSGVDDDSWFERMLSKHVSGPLAKKIPPHIKPNTISLINHLSAWMQVVFAFIAVELDETQEEYSTGVMAEGRSLAFARYGAMLARFCVAFFVCANMVLDCLDGMHARATGQSSKLGEVVDHALDAANIPLNVMGMLVCCSLDKYTMAISMFASGTVFNSQLVVYRRLHKFIKPPTNGPEAQILLAICEVVFGALFAVYGRWHPTMKAALLAVSVVGNIVQLNNTRYFWTYLHAGIFKDHLYFCLLVTLFSIVFLLDIITPFVYCVASVLMAFRLSGCYVLFTVANNHKEGQEKDKQRAVAPSLRSPLTSLYSGIDWPQLAWIAAFALFTPATQPNDFMLMGTPLAQLGRLAAYVVTTTASILYDVRVCLPYLLPKEMQAVPLWDLFL